MRTRTRILWRPFARAFGAHAARRRDSVAHPPGTGRVHFGSFDTDRVLVVGGGIAVGWGVSHNDRALPGALARELSRRTGRGTEVDLVATPYAAVSSLSALLDGIAIDRYDFVVITLDIIDGYNLAAPTSWRNELDSLLTTVNRALLPETHIAVCAIASPNLGGEPRGRLRRVIDREVADLNSIAEDLSLRLERVNFVTVPIIESHPGRDAGGNYQEWASTIAHALVRRLSAKSPGAVFNAGDTPESFERRRQQAVDELGLVGTPAEARFDEIVQKARTLFGTEIAAFSVIDNDQHWTKSVVGMPRDPLPRSGSFCATTIESAGPLVVPDTHLDPRFRKNPFVTSAPFVRFYAGFPIESPTGYRIGALCVLGFHPRALGSIDIAGLRDLALAIQSEIRHNPHFPAPVVSPGRDVQIPRPR